MRTGPFLWGGQGAWLTLTVFLASLGGLTLGVSCEAPNPEVDPEAHRTEVDRWHQARIADLQLEDGWLTLVGLYWLAEGVNTFGSHASSDLFYAGVAESEVYGDFGVPMRIGSFILRDGSVRFEAEPGVAVLTGGNPVASITLDPGEVLQPTVLQWGPLRWLAIRRQGRAAIRLKDAQSPVRTDFSGIERYPVRTEWRLPASFQRHDPPRIIRVPNVMGYVSELESPGTVVFNVAGRAYGLDVWRESADDPVNFFTAFADETNGAGTYGGGRFIWIDSPDENGHTVVDFNKAYNPPCVFTEFATCPIPPRQNRLALRVEAGEKTYAGH